MQTTSVCRIDYQHNNLRKQIQDTENKGGLHHLQRRNNPQLQPYGLQNL